MNNNLNNGKGLTYSIAVTNLEQSKFSEIQPNVTTSRIQQQKPIEIKKENKVNKYKLRGYQGL